MIYKKIIAVLFLWTTFIGMSTASTREEIKVVWGFSINSNLANTVRLMCEEINQSQDKYTFVLVNKLGAGGTIAANAVSADPNNTIVSMSSSFITRPYFETKTLTHNLDQFTPILVQGIGSPLYVLSNRIRDIDQLIKKPNATIGVGGIGTISHLVAFELQKLNPSINIIYFKSNMEATVAAAGEHIDATIGFVSDSQGLIDSKKLHIIGYTGNQLLGENKKLMLVNHSIPESANLVTDYAMYASTKMDPDRFNEIRSLLIKANNSQLVKNRYARDNLLPVNYNTVQSEVWYSVRRVFWQRQIEELKKRGGLPE